MRKFLSVFMAALMVMFSLPVVTFAANVNIFYEDVTACEFILTPDKTEVRPGDTVKYTFSLKPNGKTFGFEAHLVLPEGFTLVEGSSVLTNEVKELADVWHDLAVTEVNRTLRFTGFTAFNAYVMNKELNVAEFSCKVADEIEEGFYTVTLDDDYYVLDSQMEIPNSLKLTSPPVYVAVEDEEEEYKYDADQVTFKLTADKDEAVPGDTVNFEFSVITDGRLYGLQAYLEFPEGFTYIKGSGKLFDDVKESLKWEEIGFNELKQGEGDNEQITGQLIMGYTAENPYCKAKELKLAEFSCMVGENARTGTVSLDKIMALDSEMNKIPDTEVIFSEITVVKPKYNVSIPENVTVIRDGVELTDGDEIETGDILIITADEPENFVLKSLTVNERPFKSGGEFTVSRDNVEIKAVFAEIKNYRVYIPNNVTVTRDGVELYNNAEVTAGDELIIKANVPDGYRFGSFTINGERFTSAGITYKVIDDDVDIDVEFTEIEYYRVYIPNNVTVTRDGVELYNNAEVTAGDRLKITAKVPSGYRLDSLTVNNKAFTSGHTYTVTSEDVVIVAELWKIAQFTVTIPSNVTVTRGGITLRNGADVYTGDILTITANTPSGYRLNSLTVNGRSISNGSRYTVGSGNVTVAVSFSRISSGSSSGGSSGSSGDSSSSGSTVRHYIFIPENVEVTKDGIAVSDGSVIYRYDEFRIEVKVPEGKKLKSLTVNDTEIQSGDVYTAGTGNVIIEALFEDEETEKTTRTVIFPTGVSVTHGGNALNYVDKVSEGDILVITANTPEGYKLTSLAVNGKEIANSGIYTTGKEDPIIITVSFEKLPENRPADPFIINDPEISGWEDISKTVSAVSDKTIRIDMNGTTLLPGNVLQKIKNNGNKILLKMDEKVSWTIEGKDVTDTGRDIDLKVTLGTNNIPEDAVKRLAQNNDYLTLTLQHNGELGFKGLLVVELGTEYDTENAALYRYGDNAFTAEGRCDVLHGKGVMEFTHASEWIVVFGNGGDDPNSNNSDTSTPGTSKPDIALPNENDKDDPNKNNSSASTSTSNSGSKDKDNPVTGGSRVSLTAFLALVASAAVALVTRKRKQ